jgi:hypothetical protein
LEDAVQPAPAGPKLPDAPPEKTQDKPDDPGAQDKKKKGGGK